MDGGEGVVFFDRDDLGSLSFFFDFSLLSRPFFSSSFLSFSSSFSLLGPVLLGSGFESEVDDGLAPDPEEGEETGAVGEALAMIRQKVIKTMRIASVIAFSKYISLSPHNGHWS